MKFKNPKNYLSLYLLLICTAGPACDFCGFYPGVMPGDRRSFAGLFYRYRSFTMDAAKGSPLIPDGSIKLSHAGHDEGETKPASDAYEVFRALEFRGRYFIHPRVELNLIAPFIANHEYEGGQHQRVSGIGDITLLAGWQAVDEKITKKVNHRLLFGTGFKLPTGNYRIEENGQRLHPMIQTGTGSTDFILYANYQAGWREWGIGMNPVFKFNGTNSFHERVDHSQTVFFSLFRKLNKGKMNLLPSLQAYWENTSGIYRRGEWLPGTNMQSAMAGAGIDLFIKNISFNCNAMWTLYEADNVSGLENRMRLMAGLTWFFSQSRFALQKSSPS